MQQISNELALYKKIDAKLIKASGLAFGQPKFTYNSSEGKKEIEIPEHFDGVLTVNEFDDDWAPNEHDLYVYQSITIDNPLALFGNLGVTPVQNKIGVAVHLHSNSAYIQKKISLGAISNQSEKLTINFEHRFSKGELRGKVYFDFFFYLLQLNVRSPFSANRVGMVLSEKNLYNITLVVDGEGSIFPMTEFEDPKGSLWRLEKNWADPSEDSFDSSNVNLGLNIAHPLFEQIKSGKQRVSKAFMNEIMMNSMSLIIHQVINVEGYDLEQANEEYLDSILSVVKYWVDTFEVDTSSIFSIMNSLKENLEELLIEG